MDKVTIEVEAESLEIAREMIVSQIPVGSYILSEQVVHDGKPKTIKTIAETTEAAIAKAKSEIPLDAILVSQTVIVSPERTDTTIEAYDEQSARTQAEGSIELNTVIENLILLTPGRKGVFGLGKTLNVYRVDIFRYAIVETTFRINAKVCASIGQPDSCTVCGQTLQPSISGQMCNFLQIFTWPCPTCDVAATNIVISERGLLAECFPVLITVQKNQFGRYNLSRGYGTISSPDMQPQWFSVQDGEKVLKLMKSTFDLVRLVAEILPSPSMIEGFLREKWK